MPFTPEELAELAAFDAMIDDEPITAEERKASRQRDREAKLSALDNRQARRARKTAAYQRAYAAERKDEIAAYKRAYYDAHKAEIAAYKRAYYDAHKAEIAAYQRAYAAERKDEIAAYKRAYYDAHKAERAAYQRAYAAKHKYERAAYQRACYYDARPMLSTIRARRKRLNLSQADIARRMECSVSFVCKLEKGRITQNPKHIEAYLDVLDLFESTGTAGDA